MKERRPIDNRYDKRRVLMHTAEQLFRDENTTVRPWVLPQQHRGAYSPGDIFHKSGGNPM